MKSKLRRWALTFGICVPAVAILAQDTPAERGPPGRNLPSPRREQKRGPANEPINRDPQDPRQNQQQQQPPAQQDRETDARGFADVTIETIPGQNKVILRVPKDKAAAIRQLIADIDRASEGSDAAYQIVLLKHSDSQQLAGILNALVTAEGEAQDPASNAGLGTVRYLAMSQPNGILVVAKKQMLQKAVDKVIKLDMDVAGKSSDFTNIIQLKLATAGTIAAKLDQFYAPRDGQALGSPRVSVLADERTNSIIINAGPEDLAQVKRLISILDREDSSAALVQLRIFPLHNATAADLSSILQDAIVTRANAVSGAPGTQTQQRQQPVNLGAPQQGVSSQATLKSGSRVLLVTQDPKEKGKPIESGILEDITITPDERSNSLIVTAPEKSMNLVAALIDQLDSQPSPTVELKVFTLNNSDANSMLQTLQQVFFGSSQTTGTIGGNAQNRQQQAERLFSIQGVQAQVSLVRPSFSVDSRTNSIIASGTKSDLLAVQALIFKLDNNTARERQTIVYPLRNLLAQSATDAINQFIQQQAQGALTTGIQAQLGGNPSGLSAQIAQEVNIVGEPESNKLIISASPRYFDRVMEIIRDLDSRPPQVYVEVLIAQVTLTDGEDLGLEIGGQSSVLFDRSLIVGNSLTPGYNFNSSALLPSPAGSPASEIGHQIFSNLGLGRANPLSGIGGLVYAASSDNVSILLRALRAQQRLDVLSRPSIMTKENNPSLILIGQKVPRVQSVTTTDSGNSQSNVVDVDVGISLSVNAKISPDGVVLMGVDPVVSSLNPSNGVTIGTDGNGAPIVSPIIDTTEAHTIIAAADGQTVVIGGLINSRKGTDERKVPWLGDIPYLGWAFKTRFRTETKQELMIILTPHIVYGEREAQRIKDVEARRIHWIMRDVEEVRGNIGLSPDPEGEPAKSKKKKEKRRSNNIKHPEELQHLWSEPETPPNLRDCPPSMPNATAPTMQPQQIVIPNSAAPSIAPTPTPAPSKPATIGPASMLPSRRANPDVETSWTATDRAPAMPASNIRPMANQPAVKVATANVNDPRTSSVKKTSFPFFQHKTRQQIETVQDPTPVQTTPAEEVQQGYAPSNQITLPPPPKADVQPPPSFTVPRLSRPQQPTTRQLEKMEVVVEPENDKPAKGN